MSTPLISHDASVAEQSRKNMQDQLNGLGGINGRKLSPEAKAKKLREACEGFESIFIQKMWQEMRNTVPKGGLLQGKEERFWQDMYDQELSKSMTKAGGIGLADMMYAQLSRNLADASRSTVEGSDGPAFAPEAAPLIPQPAQKSALPEPEQPVAAASVYDGEASDIGAAPREEAPALQQPEPDAARVLQPVLQAAQTVIQASQQVEKEVKPAQKVRPQRETVRDNGLELAYLAKREAGDKLGSRAVRPPLHRKADNDEEQPATLSQIPPLQQAQKLEQPQPGSAEALRAAVAMASQSPEQQDQTAAASMRDLVAAVKMGNAAAAQPEQPMASEPEEEGQPIVRRVRKTTNIPQKQRSGKNDVIRMLNVDNASVNSKAGQGIAAYHAAQEAARQAAPAEAASQDIKPLTATDKIMEEGLSFSIPPLRANGQQG